MSELLMQLFPGISTFLVASPAVSAARIVLIALGFLLAYLGFKRTLEPLIMVPMGIAMIAVNAGEYRCDWQHVCGPPGIGRRSIDGCDAGQFPAAGVQPYLFQRFDCLPGLYGNRSTQ